MCYASRRQGFEGLVGDQAPLGFWDPLGLSADKDVEVFKRPGGMLDTHETYDATECNAEYMSSGKATC